MNKQIEECDLNKIRKVVNCVQCDEVYDPEFEELAYTYINARIAYEHFILASFGQLGGMPFISLSKAVQKGWMQLVVFLFQQNATAILAQLNKDKGEDTEDGEYDQDNCV